MNLIDVCGPKKMSNLAKKCEIAQIFSRMRVITLAIIAFLKYNRSYLMLWSIRWLLPIRNFGSC